MSVMEKRVCDWLRYHMLSRRWHSDRKALAVDKRSDERFTSKGESDKNQDQARVATTAQIYCPLIGCKSEEMLWCLMECNDSWRPSGVAVFSVWGDGSMCPRVSKYVWIINSSLLIKFIQWFVHSHICSIMVVKLTWKKYLYLLFK